MNALLLELVWFLPWCWFVNMSFTVLGYVLRQYPTIDKPLDARLCFFDGRRLLGNSTTWGGLILATALGIVGELIVPGQSFLVLAILVFVGHAFGSFIKRRLGYRNGEFLPLIDHGDYLLFIVLVSGATGLVSPVAALTAYVLTVSVTPLVTRTAHKIGIRTEPL